MISLRDATVAHFEPLIGESFGIVDHDFSFELTKAEQVRTGPRPFRLLFKGPVDIPLEQQIVPMTHDALGRLDIFVVPVDQTPDHRLYEAIFN